MSQPPHFNKKGDYAISISTAKMPFIAVGLINSALAALLYQLSMRFFELAILPDKTAASRSLHSIPEVPATSLNNPSSLPVRITTPTNPQLKPEPLDDAISSSNLRENVNDYKVEEELEAERGDVVTEVQPRHPAVYFGDAGSHSANQNHVLQSGDPVTLTDSPRSRRKRASRGRTMYPCTYPNCDRIFERESTLNTHINFHTGELPFACETPGCDRRFRSKAGLKCHEQVHLDKSARRYIHCTYPGCDRKFIRPDSAEGHLNNHLGLKPYKCTYPSCSQTFAHTSGLTHHKKQHCPPETRPHITCPHPGCDKTFLHRTSLRDHEYAHWRNRTFPCDYPGCSKICYRPSQLKAHKRTHLPIIVDSETGALIPKAKYRSKPKPIRCRYFGCDATFKYYNLLIIHTRSSHGRPKLICEFPGCNREFTLEDNRRSHYRTHLKWLYEEDSMLDAQSVLTRFPFLPNTVKRWVSKLFTVSKQRDSMKSNS